jgi:hypothetical protein
VRHTNRYPNRIANLDILKTTSTVLSVSPAQNEIQQMLALGFDLVPHRKRFNGEAQDERFKDTCLETLTIAIHGNPTGSYV